MALGQRLFVMRHGERLDSKDRNWKKTAERPYDTPITSYGATEAFKVAKQRLTGKGIGLVIASPFLRCLQTAQQVCSALDLPGVHISNGLSETMSPHCGMRGTPQVPCEKVEEYGVKIVTTDDSPFPSFPETAQESLARYLATFNHLADLHWPGNLVLVTHEYGVMKAMAAGGCTDDVEATYCGHVELKRTDSSEHSWTLENYCGVFKYDTLY